MSEQMEFKAGTGWFHFYSDLIDSGEMAEMNRECAAMSAVLLVMKRHLHEQKFKDWGKTEIPSIKVMAEQSGFSRNTVSTSLEKLEARGFIRLVQPHIPGRKKRYEYWDRILIRQQTANENEENPVVGEVMVPYDPKMVMVVQDAIKQALTEMSQGIAPDKSNSLFQVNINKEYRNLFVQNIAKGATGTQTNTGVIESVEEIHREIASISAKIDNDPDFFREGTEQIGKLHRQIRKLTQENKTKE